jgi:hypothetical protein
MSLSKKENGIDMISEEHVKEYYADKDLRKYGILILQY